MSFLTQYATRHPSARRGARVDERTILNLPAFDGGAHVRVFVEDTSAHKFKRRRPPSPRLKLRIADCSNKIWLHFSVDSREERANSLHKIDALVAALVGFREALAAEAELRERREHAGRCGPEQHRSLA